MSLLEKDSMENNKKYEDLFGFEIIGLKQCETKEEKIIVLRQHLEMLEGLSNESISDIERRISDLKYN